jgi:hypothetical protein
VSRGIGGRGERPRERAESPTLRFATLFIAGSPSQRRMARSGPDAEHRQHGQAARGRPRPNQGIALQRRTKLRIATSGISGGRSPHEAVSRRPPISLYTIVARTHMYTYDAQVWDLSAAQGPSSRPVTIRPSPTATPPPPQVRTAALLYQLCQVPQIAILLKDYLHPLVAMLHPDPHKWAGMEDARAFAAGVLRVRSLRISY